MNVRHLSIYIARAPHEVYEFASEPANLPRWAAGLARAELRREGDVWIADAPFGTARIRFADSNLFGVMDHEVELDSGEVVHNPMRVVRRGNGSEFIFSLFQRPGMSDEDFEADASAVEADLKQLKEILEG